MKPLSSEELKERQLYLLKTLDAICREHSIEYIIAYGTLLGAVRHGGFIPWDDDVDLMMRRKEYNRLRELLSSEDFGIKFIDIETQPDTIYPFAKISDNATALYEHNFRKVPNLGVNLDIFPIDELPLDKKKRAIFLKKNLFRACMIAHSARTGYEKSNSFSINLKRRVAFCVGNTLVNTEKAIKNLYRTSQYYNGRDTGIMGAAWGEFGYPSEYFYHSCDIEFAEITVLAPKNADGFLKCCYGDYMKLPPKEEQIAKHSFDAYWIESKR